MTTEGVPPNSPVPSNLPAELTSFVGRHKSLAAGLQLLTHARLVTLTGVGGVGKTRLALRIAAEAAETQAEHYPDGVWMVSLAELSEPGQIAAHLAETLSIPYNTTQPVSLDILLGDLRKMRLLLLLDNCEHLSDHVSGLTRRVLLTAPGVRVLATSRETLQLPGEHLLPVTPLDAGNDDPSGTDDTVHYEAVELLEDRAAAVNVNLGPTERPHVVRLCQLLDGIPLAIELAAVRLRSMGIQDLVYKIENDGRFGILDAGTHYGQPWHRTLSAAIDWSYELCNPAEQHLWDRLSVFPGSFSPDAAEAVCADEQIDAADITGLIVRLVDQSILTVDTRGGRTRYRMLESLRAYGALKLRERGEEEQLRQAHAKHYKAQAFEVVGAVRSEHEIEWLRQIRLEMPSFRASLDWFLTHDRPHEALELTLALAQTRWGFYMGQLGEAREMLRRTLDAQTEPHPLQVPARSLLAYIDISQGHNTLADFELGRANATVQDLGNPPELNSWLLFGEGLRLLFVQSDPRAITVLDEARRQWHQYATPGSVYPGRSFIAMTAAFVGSEEVARREAEEGLRDAESTGAPLGCAWARWCAGLAELHHGSPYRAAELFVDALTRQMTIGDMWGPAWSLEGLAWASVACGHYERAAVLMGAARRQQLANVTLIDVGIVANVHQRWATIAKARLGVDEFDAAVKRGMAMSRAEVLEYAPVPGELASGPRDGIPGGLTAREYEVAGLVAAGLTNREIAEKLVLSSRTIDTHVQAVRHKLGISGNGSRIEIAQWWAANCGGASRSK